MGIIKTIMQKKQWKRRSKVEKKKERRRKRRMIETENKKITRNLKEVPIFYYASKVGLLSEHYKQDQDLVLTLRCGINEKEYVYNKIYDTLQCKDSSGTRYYTKSDKDREKLSLIYELKKLYLKKQEDEYTEKLQNGKFYDNTLLVRKSFSQNINLEDKIKNLNSVIGILNEQSPNYGHCFGKQTSNFIEALHNLKQYSDGLNLTECADQAATFLKQSFVTSSAFTKTSTVESITDVNKKSQHIFINKCIEVLRFQDFQIEKIEQLTNLQEYIDLSKTNSNDIFGNLIRYIKHKTLLVRKEQIEKELNKGKFIEAQIRNKRNEIRKTKGCFSEEYLISEENEKRFERLLKANESKTNRKYREGLSRTKEKTDENKLKSGMMHCRYDEAYETKDVTDVTYAIDKEYLRIKIHEEDIINKEQELIKLREDDIPTLEEEYDLLSVLEKQLKDEQSELNSKTEKYQRSKLEKEREIRKLEKDNEIYKVLIKAQYQRLSTLLTEIDELKKTINGLKNAKKSVSNDEIKAFKDAIFEKAGGQKKGKSDTGFFHHVDCDPEVCRYRWATDKTVDFALNQIFKEKILELNEMKLFNHLSGFFHSANDGYSPEGRGKGKHASYLKFAGKRVFLEYSDVQKRIAQRENEYQAQIKGNENKRQDKEYERYYLRENIVDKENELNKAKLQFDKIERDIDILIRQGSDNDKQVTLITNYIDATNYLKQSIHEVIEKKRDQINELSDGIVDKKDKINEIEEETNKENEYNLTLALSEQRWKYSQYEKVITNIGNLENQNRERERLESEIYIVEEKIKANLATKDGLDYNLTNKRVKQKVNLGCVEILVQEKNNLIAKRSLLDAESKIGLVNTIEVCRTELMLIEKQQQSDIRKINKARAEIIKRKVYEKLDLMQKGTTKNDDDYLDDIGTVNQLYKKRRHKNCQDVFNKDDQACKYFEALEIALKVLLETNTKSNYEIFAELRSKNHNYENHVLLKHKEELMKNIEIIRYEIVEFNRKMEKITTKYTDARKLISQRISNAKEQLIQKKKLDGIITIKNLASSTIEQDEQSIRDYLDIGVDCVVVTAIDQMIIYTCKKFCMNIKQFTEDVISSLPNDQRYNLPVSVEHIIHQELITLLNSRKPVSMEAILIQKKETCQQLLYKYLVNYFDKTYLKKKLQIVAKLSDIKVLEGEIRNMTSDIEKTDKENKKLRSIEYNLKENLSLTTNEIERLKQICHEHVLFTAAKGSEIHDFERMKALCVELLEKAKQENEKEIKERKMYADKMKNLKSANRTLNLSKQSFDMVTPDILKNRLKNALHSDKNCHRNCYNGGDQFCDFFSKLEKIIEYTLNKIQNNQIALRAPNYNVSIDNQNRLIDQLQINKEHSEKHKRSLKHIVAYVVERCGQKKEKILSEHQHKIKILEGKIEKIENQNNARNQILMPELEKRIQEIDNFFIFRKEALFLGERSTQENTSQKELIEYKEEKFKILFRAQVDNLIECMSLISRIVRNRSGEKAPIEVNAISSIKQCIYEVFSKYYDNLSTTDSLFLQLIDNLKQELNEENKESNITILVKKKSAKMGGVEYLLRKISLNFQQNNQYYNELLDPEKIYYNILLKQSQINEKVEGPSLEILQKELSHLQIQKKVLFMKDNSILREELENIDTGIKYMENKKDVTTLRNRLEEIEDTRNNKDDYYSFDMDNRRVCVRLLGADPVEKSAEIKEIDKIRNYIIEHNRKLLEQKVIQDIYNQELQDEKEKEFKVTLLDVQRKLLLKGISLCGYDTFANGESLDKINSLISVIIGVLIGENYLYQIGYTNATSRRVEEWTKKIRLKYNEFILSAEFTKLDKVRFIINAVNEEFETDNLYITQIIIIGNEKNNLQSICISNEKHRNITILVHEAKHFVLTPQNNIKIYDDDTQIDASIKITRILTVLQTEEDLFKHLCYKRLQHVQGVTLEHCKKLAEHYKKEKNSLVKISSIKDFNALFCHVLDLDGSSDFQSSYLLAYLVYLENLENMSKGDPQEKIKRLKVVKNLYDKVLFTTIKVEQQKRKKKNEIQSGESKEELYLKELIKAEEEELASDKLEISRFTEKIEKDQALLGLLLCKKEKTRDKFLENMEELTNISISIKEKLKFSQEKIKELNKNEQENQERIKKVQADGAKLEIELAVVEQGMKLKQNDKEVIEIDIDNLKKRKEKLDRNLRIRNAEKGQKEKEMVEKKTEIEVSKYMADLITNLQLILAHPEFHLNKEKIVKSIYTSNNLKTLFEALRQELEKLQTGNKTNLWQELMKDINYEQLKEYLRHNNRISGELQHDFLTRLLNIIRNGLNFTCEISQDMRDVGGKPINCCKISATNITHQELHSKVKECVEKEIRSTDASRGLIFKNDVLFSEKYSISGINNLPNELKVLIQKRIEFHYKSDEVKSKKKAKSTEAAEVINELKIDYKSVVKSYVDEIQVIASGKFILNHSASYPGIDLTVNAVDMECVGEGLSLDTSGKHGVNFRYAASDGSEKRIHEESPKGDKGYDGYDGDHGDHAGHIVIRVENEIKNLQALTSIKANGGDGGEGQLGGNGDVGSKGKDGKHGMADDIKFSLGGQLNIGFGSPGTPGGRGGAAGATGRPGIGGKAGVIDITHKAGKIMWGEMKSGRDADNILEKVKKPMGGDGGEPGIYGMDQVKIKKHLFAESVQVHTVIDRDDLLKRHEEYRDEILHSDNFTISIVNTAWKKISKVKHFDDVVINFGKNCIELAKNAIQYTHNLLNNFKKLTKEDIKNHIIHFGSVLLTGAGIAAASGIAIPAAVLAVLTLPVDEYKEYTKVDNPLDYRSRDRESPSKRGQKNEDEIGLRNDNRYLPQDKRLVVNIDSLHGKLNEKKNDDKDLCGETRLNENMYDLMVEQEELVNEIEACTQEVHNYQCEKENTELAIEGKILELEKIYEDIASLQNKETAIDSERRSKIKQVIKAITESQNIRDKKKELDLDIEQTLAKLEDYNVLGEEFYGNKKNLIEIIDEYLEAVKVRLRKNRYDLKVLKKDIATRELNKKSLNKKLNDLHQERLVQIENEVEVQQEIEEEAETQHIENITNIIDAENRNTHLQAECKNKPQINETSYIVKNIPVQNIPENIPDIEDILKQSIRHYRSGVLSDEEVELITKAINKKSEQVGSLKSEFKKMMRVYKNEIKNIRISRNMDTLSAIERNLLLDYLNNINNHLKMNPLANFCDFKFVESFILKLVKLVNAEDEQEYGIIKMLQLRFNNECLFGNDELIDDIDILISLINDRKTFYLEKCAINFVQRFGLQTECEKIMLSYNLRPSLENLVCLVDCFKKQVIKMNDIAQLNKEYLVTSVNNFITTVVENIRYYGILLLNNIIENSDSYSKNNVEQHQENLFKPIQIISDDIKLIKLRIKLVEDTIIENILKVLILFRKYTTIVNDNTKPKKLANKTIRSLKAIVSKLIKYTDSKSNREVERVYNHYTKLGLGSEDIENISEQFKNEEERITNTVIEQADKTVEHDHAKPIQITDKSSRCVCM